MFDDLSEPEAPEFYDQEAENEDVGGTEDPDAKRGPGESNIVNSGDIAAAKAAERKNTVDTLKKKKIKTEDRKTTPYMTKYERARVLGTRALQIRYAS